MSNSPLILPSNNIKLNLDFVKGIFPTPKLGIKVKHPAFSKAKVCSKAKVFSNVKANSNQHLLRPDCKIRH